MNQEKGKFTLPAWLDGRTIALLVALMSLGTMMQTAHSRIGEDMNQVRTDMNQMRTDVNQVRTDMNNMRLELSANIEKVRHDLGNRMATMRDGLGAQVAKLDDRLRAVEVDVAAIRAGMFGIESRLGAVEQHARHLAEPVAPGHGES